ncbi:hypothetical protein Tco_0479572, partial [Tanacetum coccineum]
STMEQLLYIPHLEILVYGASWSIDVDTCESAISTALGASATGIGETVSVGGLKY